MGKERADSILNKISADTILEDYEDKDLNYFKDILKGVSNDELIMIEFDHDN